MLLQREVPHTHTPADTGRTLRYIWKVAMTPTVIGRTVYPPVPNSPTGTE
jgi:hypothetical protein